MTSRVQQLRTAMLEAITPADVQAVVSKLIDLARNGDLKAATLLFSVIGKPTATATMTEPATDSGTERVTSERIRHIAERILSRRLANAETTAVDDSAA